MQASHLEKRFTVEVIDAYFAIAQSCTFFPSLSCYDNCFTLLPVKSDEIIVYTYGSFSTARQQGLMVQWLEQATHIGNTFIPSRPSRQLNARTINLWKVTSYKRKAFLY